MQEPSIAAVSPLSVGKELAACGCQPTTGKTGGLIWHGTVYSGHLC